MQPADQLCASSSGRRRDDGCGWKARRLDLLCITSQDAWTVSTAIPGSAISLSWTIISEQHCSWFILSSLCRIIHFGSFLTLDLGGTNLRVCWISLTSSKGEIKVTQDQFTLPHGIKTGHADQFWDYVADSIQKFLKKHNLEGGDGHPIPLGFTFSYPATQDDIDHGVLQTWTKGFDIEGVEGEDVARQLRDAMETKVTCLFADMGVPEC